MSCSHRNPNDLLSVLVALLSITLCATAEEPAPRLQRFSRLPDWALKSWMMRRQAEPEWALAGGHVIDIRTGNILESANVVIKGDRIARVDREEIPEGVEVVEIDGKFVIPGLFDLHAHVMPASLRFPGSPPAEEALRALLDSGVTVIRALPLTSELAHEWSAKINQGDLVGPTLVVASGIFEKTPQRTTLGFGDPETARAWVLREALLGSRWIKVYNKMDEASLRVIVETARGFGMRVCGHASDVAPREASQIGMASIEHVIDIPQSCLKGLKVPDDLRDLGSLTAWRWEHAGDAELAALMKLFRDHGTAWVPTLVVTEKMTERGGHDGKPFGGEETVEKLRAGLKKAARLAVQQHRDGGLVGLGTDFPIDGVRPGESAHREMELFVELGGASPIEALQIATIGSARVLGFSELVGTVEAGRLANLLVLDANPLENISQIRSIRIVVHDGRRRVIEGR